ncbi:hypothetical protein [Okeania sp. SIO1F9]|uniref:hypothetical protein n=1 Tax=Okeania sp. SIO1F9 TaxID=2607813 RepID=UPI00144F176C|nr:hypothetical protein [Okeania sp. SIO1F9]NET76709.1 hypothetical protein [Okeania sp. SIO1F9]
MADIQINELKPAGYDFFEDSESFLDDLSEEELLLTQGGIPTPVIPVVTSSEPCALFVFAGVTVILQPDKK